MIQTTVKVSGMVCSMCEAHINDAIRAAFSVEKVSSSHSKGETVILSKEPLGENALRAAINATGYMAGEISTAVYEKKGFFHFICAIVLSIERGLQSPAENPGITLLSVSNTSTFNSPFGQFTFTNRYSPVNVTGRVNNVLFSFEVE